MDKSSNFSVIERHDKLPFIFVVSLVPNLILISVLTNFYTFRSSFFFENSLKTFTHHLNGTRISIVDPNKSFPKTLYTVTFSHLFFPMSFKSLYLRLLSFAHQTTEFVIKFVLLFDASRIFFSVWSFVCFFAIYFDEMQKNHYRSTYFILPYPMQQ